MQLIWRDRPLVWCGALTVVHVLCDIFVGFQHQLLGPDSPQVSLDTYARAPVLAIGIELIFAYLTSEARRGRPLARRRMVALYAVFAVGILMWLPATSMSLRQTFG